MEDSPISQLPVLPGDSFDNTDQIAVARAGTTYRAAISRILKFFGFEPTGTPTTYVGYNADGDFGIWPIPSAGGGPFNGNRPIKRIPTVGLNVGTTGTLADWVDAVFFPFIAAAVNINSGGNYEVGSTQDVTVSGSITLNDAETLSVTNRRVQKNGSDWQTFLTSSYSYADTITRSTPGAVTYQALVDVADSGNGSPGTKTSALRSDTFHYFKFWGTPGSVPVNSANVRALGNSGFANTFTLNIPQGQTIIVFAYPASLPDIADTSVRYVEGFNAPVGATFTKNVFNVNDAGGTPVSYKVYICVLPAPYPSAANYVVTL